MSYIKKLKETAKAVSLPVWIAGLVIPGGMTAIVAFLAYKASKKDKQPEKTLEEIKKEVENEHTNDR